MVKSTAILPLSITLLLAAGMGCTSATGDKRLNEVACNEALSLVDQMEDSEQFPLSPRTLELNAELETVSASGEIKLAIVRVVNLTNQWVEVGTSSEPNSSEDGFATRSDLEEARLALRRVCR